MSAAAPAGVVPVLKPPGMTSHDVVDRVRRLLGLRRVGHAGTLDPLAAGVLLVLVGPATRASPYLQGLPKAYRAEALFGLVTDAGDLDGRVLRRAPCPHLTPERVEAALPAFVGRIRQRPPALSAVKVGGLPAYRRVRRGEEPQLPERQVDVYRLALVRWQPDPAHPRALLDLECSSGTYVRSLVRDLGEALGVGACLGFLVRTRVGPFGLADAWTLEELAAALARGDREPLLPLARALAFLPAVDLGADEARAVGHGILPAGLRRRLPRDGPVRLLDPDGQLRAIAGPGPAGPRLECVFPPGGGPAR